MGLMVYVKKLDTRKLDKIAEKGHFVGFNEELKFTGQRKGKCLSSRTSILIKMSCYCQTIPKLRGNGTYQSIWTLLKHIMSLKILKNILKQSTRPQLTL